MFPHPQNSLTAGAENSPKISANFSLSGSKGKLAELFGYYSYLLFYAKRQNILDNRLFA